MITIPLKAKYRSRNFRLLRRTGVDPHEGTMVWMAEAHACKGRTGNSSGPTPKWSKSTSGNGKRRKAYGPF